MPKLSKIFIILLLLGTNLSLFALSELELDAGYNTNVTEDAYAQGSAYFIPRITFKNTVFLTPDQILFSDLSAQIKTYFSIKEENMVIPNGSLKWRMKGRDQVLDISLKGYSEYLYNDKEYTFYQLSVNPQYRYDFETLSLYLGAETGVIQYPNYAFDRYYLKGYAATAFDVTWKFSLDFKIGTEKEWFSDRYILDNSYNNTQEKMERTKLFAKGGFNWLLSPNLDITGWGLIEKEDSNGNYYYYGPEEDVLIVDGDEALFPDYYTKTSWEAGMEINYHYDEGSFALAVSFAADNYATRYPLDNSGTPLLNDSMRVERLGVQTVWKIFLSEENSLSLHYQFQKKFSNDYYEEALIHNGGISLNILF